MRDAHINSKEETYTRETTETAKEFIHIIEVLTRLNGIEVEICGTWIWVSGNIKEHREILKQPNFKWANKKQAWYYHTEPYKKRSKRELTLDEIREMFRSQSYKQKEENELALQG